MVKLKLEIKTTTDAFGDCPEYELQRILRDLADDMLRKNGVNKHYTLVDHLGNTVGKATWS